MLIIGYTTRKHLLLDLDNTTYMKAEYIARLIICNWPEVGHILIVRSKPSSGLEHTFINRFGIPKTRRFRGNYHLVADNNIVYRKCTHIIQTLAELGVLNKDYTKIRKFRGDMTLRVTPKWTIAQEVQAPEPLKLIRNRRTRRHDGALLTYLSFALAATVALLSCGVPKAVTRNRADHADDAAEVNPVRIRKQSYCFQSADANDDDYSD